MATRKELALDAVLRVHGNTACSLEDVKDDLEEIRDLAEELISAIEADIEMQSE